MLINGKLNCLNDLNPNYPFGEFSLVTTVAVGPSPTTDAPFVPGESIVLSAGTVTSGFSGVTITPPLWPSGSTTTPGDSVVEVVVVASVVLVVVVAAGFSPSEIISCAVKPPTPSAPTLSATAPAIFWRRVRFVGSRLELSDVCVSFLDIFFLFYLMNTLYSKLMVLSTLLYF